MKQLTSSQHQPFSQYQQPQQPGIQQEEQKKAQKSKNTEIPTFLEKPRKQTKSALHQKVSQFNPSGQMSMEQLIQVELKLQEEVKRLKKDNDKLMENLSKQEEIESRLMSQERELSAFCAFCAFWNISQSQNCQSQNQQQKQTELGNKFGEIEEKLQQQIELNVQRGDPMLIEVIGKKKKIKPIKVVKRETLMKKMLGIPKLQEPVLEVIKEIASLAKEKETTITKENQRETIHELA